MSNAYDRRSDKDAGSDYVAGGRPLNGGMVLAIFVGLFLIVFGANAAMTYFAVKTFSGEVIAHPYENGLAYNREIAAARAQETRDWKVDVQLTPASAEKTLIIVTLRNAAGDAVTGLDLEVVLVAPANLKHDIRVRLEEKGNGRYVGDAAVVAGRRELVLTAKRTGQEVFRSQNRLDSPRHDGQGTRQ
jgi:nitrogen fixation protein FixH